MENIISDIQEMIKRTNHLIDFEEALTRYMYQSFSTYLGDVLSGMDQQIKRVKQAAGWTVVRSDNKTVNFTFGPVTFKHTSMRDKRGVCRFPLDECLGIAKYQRYSALVEVKVAEMASETDYRETARVINEWTALGISHASVANIVKRVGKAQAKADETMIEELEVADGLPEGKKVDFLFAEADGVYVKSTKRKKGIEVSQAIVYEGWHTSGRRVSLKHPMVIMSTEGIDKFWREIQALTTHKYTLSHTRIITNSDGGIGYGSGRFQETFSQSAYPVLTQLDRYHIAQAIVRTFGAKRSPMKDGIRKAIERKDLDAFRLWVDTFESTVEDDRGIQKIHDFRRYIENQWSRIFDWRKEVEEAPAGARSLGAIESNQRRVSYRMKKRGMHWSQSGCLGMVKILQGKANGTLRDAYITFNQVSDRKKRLIKQSVRMNYYLTQPTQASIGVKNGGIALYGAHTSAIGALVKAFR